MIDKMTWRQQQAAVGRVEEGLEALATENCNGTDEYRNCAVHSLQAQAMAKALLTLIADEARWPGQNGDHTEMLIKLGAELERADTI